MSREIKFRAWDKNDNEMRYDAQDTYDYIVNNIMEDCFGDVLKSERYEVMQYTGLKDKNGKEIYEGDVVKMHGWWNAFGPAGYDSDITVVEFDEEVCGFTPMCNYDCDCGVYHNASDLEVIGNIYENPKLIKGKKK